MDASPDRSPIPTHANVNTNATTMTTSTAPATNRGMPLPGTRALRTFADNTLDLCDVRGVHRTALADGAKIVVERFGEIAFVLHASERARAAITIHQRYVLRLDELP